MSEHAAHRPMVPCRVAGRVAAAEALHAGLRARALAHDDGASMRAIALRLGVSHTTVERWASPLAGVPVSLGDVLAMGHDTARAILCAAVAVLESQGPSVRDTLDAVAIDLGEAVAALRRDLADGREDDDLEHAARLEQIAARALRGAAEARRRAAR